jgi:hypothetical protein
VLALPRWPRQLGPQHLGHVHLHHDFPLEVAPGVHVEVLVSGAGEAVVAHDPVRDEVAGAGGDVVETPLGEALDRLNAQLRIGLERSTGDRSLTGDRWIDHVEEPKVLTESATDPDIGHSVGSIRAVERDGEAEMPEAGSRPSDDFWVGIGDSENAARA